MAGGALSPVGAWVSPKRGFLFPVKALSKPAGFKRIRHYGLLASRHKTQKLTTCRALFNLPPPAPLVIESVEAFMARVAQLDVTRCLCCSTDRLIFRAALMPLRRPFTPRSSTGPPLA